MSSQPVTLEIDGRPFPFPCVLPLSAGVQRLCGSMTAAEGGLLILSVTVPRPLRIRWDEVTVLEEALPWRSFQRLLRAVVLLPLSTGKRSIRFEVGERPWVPSFVEHECPSRNREAVRAALARCFPDEIRLSATFLPGQRGPALSLRFHAGQFIEGGVVFQETGVRRFDAEMQPPPIEFPRDDFRFEGERQTVSIESGEGKGYARDASTSAELAAGRMRLYVPVALADEVPVARECGMPEERPEPHLVPVGETKVRVTCGADEVTVAMPIFEVRGRRAPVREYRHHVFPTLQELLAAVPEPVLPHRWQAFADLYREAWRLIARLERHPPKTSGLPGLFLRTAMQQFEHHQFVWDSSFTSMAAAYAWRVLPVSATLDVLYSRQMDGGYLHREHDIRDGMPAVFEPDFSPNPPLMAVAEVAIARLTGEKNRFRLVYPALVEQFRWLELNRRLPDGTYWTTGLANGLDNSPSLGDGYPDLTAQMAHFAEALGVMARSLGRDDEAALWEEKRIAIGEALNRHLWSDALAFYSTSLAGGGHNPNKVVTGFWPLWTALVPPERVANLARHLKDPASFWRYHPVPSLAADSPQYVPQGDYWRGSTWAPTNYMVSQGFQRAGRIDLARELVERHLEVLGEVYRETGHLWENYCAESPGPGSWAGPDYSWTVLGPIASLIETLIGIRGDALAMRLDFTPEPKTKVGVKRYPLGPATVDVIQMNRHGKDVVEVHTDYPLDLVVHRSGKTVRCRCRPGMSSVTVE